MHGTVNRLGILPAVAGVACLFVAALSAAQPQSTALAFETEGLDLETGEVIDLSDPEVDEAAADFHLAYNADRAPHAVLFQAVGAEIALMSDTAFEYVTASDIPSLVFTTDLIDEPCDGGDTVVLRTLGGSVYKIGNLLEDPSAEVVVLDYELLQSPQAALSVGDSGRPVRVAAPPGAANSRLVMADSALGKELPPLGLSSEAHRAITSHIERDLYGVRRTPDGALGGSSLEGGNPAQAYNTRFTRDGIHVRPQGADSELGLKLAAWGYGETLSPVAPATPRADGQRVEYVRGELTEWYVNRSSGLEQGFTLAAPPQGARGEAGLQLEMTLSGPLVAEASGGSILFRDASGTTRLRYGGLTAWDAAGRELAAGMRLTENRLTLEVDDLRALYPVTVDPTILNENAKLLANDGAAGDQLGWTVAVSGDTVVVGAYTDDDNGTNSGSAYVFEKPAGGWSGTLNHAAKLLASDGTAGDQFGRSIAISGDTVVVGAIFDDDNGTSSGSAYVFEEPVGGWVGSLNQAAKLLASDGVASDFFGWAVAVSGDTVAVGAIFDGDNGFASGSVYVFEKLAGGWVGTLNQAAKLLASDGAGSDFFGWSVAVSGDTVAVGAIQDDDHGTNSGSAYVFEKPGGGWVGTLNQAAKLLASDGAGSDQFGRSVTASGDTVGVGAIFDDDHGANSGSAYVFEKPAGGWVGTLNQAAKLLASDGAGSDLFGFSVAVSGDTMVVGAAFDDDNGASSGSAYVFEEPGGGWTGTLNQTAKLLASDGAGSDQFGRSVAVSGDTVVVGAVGDDDKDRESGSAYVFNLGAGCIDNDGDGLGSPGDASCPAGPEQDNCPDVANAGQEDEDGDGEGDACDANDIQAVCVNTQLAADETLCQATLPEASVDGGSFDPDGDPVTTNQTPAGPYPLGSTLGVELEVDDVVFDGPDDAPAICLATVDVVDGTPPALTLIDDPTPILECNVDGYDEHGAAVSDACDPDVSVVISGDAVDPSLVGTYNVHYDAADASGNMASTLVRSVTVRDTRPPAIVPNGDPMPFLECRVDSYAELGAVGVDECDPLIDPIAIGGDVVITDAVANFVVTYDGFDDSGNPGVQGSRNISVIDTTPPEIALNPGPSTVECILETYNEPGAVATDLCDPAVPVVITGSVDAGTVGGYAIDYNATDESDNSAPQATRQIDVLDTIAPVITPNAGLSTLECNVDTYVEPGAALDEACDVTAAVITAGSVDESTLGSHTITYDASDASGNVAVQQVRELTVADTLAPTITLAGGDLILECAIDPFTDPGASVTDLCDPLVAVVVGGDPVDSSVVGGYDVTYDATDGSGNMAPTLVRGVTVQDTLPPTIVPVGDPVVTLECGVDAYAEIGATGLDECDPLIDPITIGGDAVSTGAVASFSVTYDGSDDSGNAGEQAIREVIVQDTIAPVITPNAAPSTLECNVDTYVEPGAALDEACDPTATLVIAGSVNESIAGAYAITYDATDSTGNEAVQQVRNLTVVDTEAPTIALVGGDLILECAIDSFADPGSSATDTCDPAVAVLVGGDTVNTGTVGTFNLSYDATDDSGNVADTLGRQVTVQDTLAPVLAVNGDPAPTLECAVDSYTELGVSVTEVCDPEVPVAIGGATVDPSTVGSYVVTYDGADDVGNAATQQSRTVTVTDTLAPTIAVLGDPAPTLQCGVDAYVEAGASATDLCDPTAPVSIGGDTVNTTAVGVYSVSYDATDAFGNAAATANRPVTVADTLAPTITCPAGLPLILDTSCETQVPDVASLVTASDECADPGSLTITQDLAPGLLVGPGSYTVTVTATDAAGNSAQCQTVLTAPFEFDGFLPPIDGADATGGSFGDPVRSFKLKSTVPVKFKISCSGVPHVEDVHTLQAIHYTSATDSDPPIDATPQDAATTGNEFRLTGDQWHYNLDTQATGMSMGQWQFVATLSDGTTHFVWVQVK